MINLQLPIVIAGPTASGKSAIALNFAKKNNGIIICADSRQIYQHMRIGTASPSDEDLAQVEHLGFNCRSPLENYDAALFVRDTLAFVDEVLKQKKVPIIVGGTGLYLRALRFGLNDVQGRCVEIRERLEQEAAQSGLAVLHARLAAVDEAAAARIHMNDPVRIVRALELFELHQSAPQALMKSHFSDDIKFNAQWFLLWPERSILHVRIKERIEVMFSAGLVDEALALRKILPEGHRLLKTMGYEEALRLADGEIFEKEALELVLIRQRQYAKRQYTWFKKETWWQRDLGDLV